MPPICQNVFKDGIFKKLESKKPKNILFLRKSVFNSLKDKLGIYFNY